MPDDQCMALSPALSVTQFFVWCNSNPYHHIVPRWNLLNVVTCWVFHTRFDRVSLCGNSVFALILSVSSVAASECSPNILDREKVSDLQGHVSQLCVAFNHFDDRRLHSHHKDEKTTWRTQEPALRDSCSAVPGKVSQSQKVGQS